MKFSYLFFVVFLIHGSFSWSINPLERQLIDALTGRRLEKRSPIINKFNFAFANDKRTTPVLRQQEAFRIFKDMQKEKEMKIKKEKEDRIYRKYLASSIRSSIARDFLTMRY